ncbi:hypothetical protein SUDANB95_04618 [Actinosynnema sp. ALI-1.44]
MWIAAASGVAPHEQGVAAGLVVALALPRGVSAPVERRPEPV